MSELSYCGLKGACAALPRLPTQSYRKIGRRIVDVRLCGIALTGDGSKLVERLGVSKPVEAIP